MYNQITRNKRNTWLLLIIFVVFFVALGYVFGYGYGGRQDAGIGMMGIFGIIAIIYAAISYYTAGKLTLAISKAKEIEKRDHFELFTTVENLAIAAGLPTPKIYLIDDTALNAFATGRDPEHAAVAITKGLLENLDKSELQGVMAHEISHIQNYDIRIQSLTVALVGLIALVSDIFLRSLFYGRHRRSSRRSGGRGGALMILIGVVLAILSPIIAKLMHMAISREREYLADASGALLTRYPEGLARALEKIDADHEPLEVANKATAHLYIENPLRNEKGMKWLNKLFSSHPPTDDRIGRLRNMGA